MAGWYIRRGEKVVGPVDAAKLKELVADGRLLPTDLLANDAGGPWKNAGDTKLFKAPEQPTSIVPSPEQLPAIPEQQPSAKAATALGVARVFFGAIGRGSLSVVQVVSKSAATRAQRKHELKLAKIQAQALADSQRPPAPRPAPPPAPAKASQPITFAPQIVQTTVVKVVNKQGGGCGCSGCGVLLLLIVIGIAAFVIFSNMQPPP